MLYKRTEHIRKRVSLVVQVLDDVTNKMIYGSIIQVELVTGEKPIQKSDGYYVFFAEKRGNYKPKKEKKNEQKMSKKLQRKYGRKKA